MDVTDTSHSLESAIEALHEQGVTDGLPVIPPTPERVEAMLGATPEAPDHAILEFGDEADLMVEMLAECAVLAGCAPIHMPVLVASAEAMAAQESNVLAAVDDPGSWSFQWIVNGPVREMLDIRSDTGAFGPGFWANRSIGRALGLAFSRTVGKTHPDASVTGTPFKHTLVAAENEEKSPWDPYHVDAGYDSDASTITLSIRRSFIQYIPYGMDPNGILQSMQYNTIPDMVGRNCDNHRETIVHTLGPYNAEELDVAGFSKEDVKEYLSDNSVRPWDEIGPALTERSGVPVAETKPLQAAQIESPDDIQIYVIGGSGRFNATGHAIGGPVTNSIGFPDHWDELLDEYSVERDWGEITEAYDATNT